jgi:hypothetical protein
MRDWFKRESEPDYQKLKERVCAFKLFYYDCLDDIQRTGESDKAFRARVEVQQEKFDNIRSIVGAHVRLGSLAGRRERPSATKGSRYSSCCRYDESRDSSEYEGSGIAHGGCRL